MVNTIVLKGIGLVTLVWTDGTTVIPVDFIIYKSMKTGRVRESLIKPEKTSTHTAFEENTKRSLCSWFSVTHVHDP